MTRSTPHLALRRPLDRRSFLRGAGATVALPFLDAMRPSLFGQDVAETRRRAIFINLHLGFMARYFTPKTAGRDYELTKYLEVIAPYREDFTVITGTSHPGVNGAHSADVSFLTGAPDAASASFKNSVSIDQIIAERIGNETRYAYLPLGFDTRSSSFSHSGANIPAINRPSSLYQKLFIEGSAAEKASLNRQLEDGSSIMDFVNESAKAMSKRLGQRDREKLDEYFTNIRETEQRLQKSRDWQDVTKPKAPVKQPKDVQDRADFIAKIALMYDMMHLAIQSDSSRVITFNQPNLNDVLPMNGISQGYHSLSHHNGDPDKLRQLALVEIEQMEIFSILLKKLAETQEDGAPLLDKSMIMLGSIFGDANTHNCSNMPILLAGGGFEHGQHLAFDPQNNTPTCNIFVSMLERLGIHDISSFASSSGKLTGLELESA
ncbi:MAG: DUF1552 domain-containing protein [Verrucomicrobiota bacterium]